MAQLLASNTVKRGGSHPESQLPIIPFGTTGQTSCRDQLQSMDGPSDETRLEPKHKIFLSHSGMQKSFVAQLCKDMERYDRYPFFDLRRTSLSIGCDFPKEIFKAIEQCEVAVVVLSEDIFSRTKWPMLELSALVKRKGDDPDLIIMPVFLSMTRDECRESENQERWFSLWEGWAEEDSRIVLDDWKAVFKVFGSTNSISLGGWDEVKCREDIVDAVCKEVSAETRCDDSHVQGKSRMCKTIDEKIGGLEPWKRNGARVLGLYGVGGIGKSTACMSLCNHYFEDFHGRVCHVEFGVGDELHMLREILKRLTNIEHQQIERLSINECKHGMKNMRNEKIFLAIDNVFESHQIVQQAKLILSTRFAKGSIVIVTARSLGELRNLNLEESECMGMPELLLEDAISLFVKEVACCKSTNQQLILECVKRCYFLKGDGSSGHYHPLALRVLGGQLGSDSSQWLEKLKKIDVFNQYRERSNQHPIFSILRRSFDILEVEDQLLFMDCALFAIHAEFIFEDSIFPWLSMIHGDELKSRLNGLKQKSVIEAWEDGGLGIGIHDLWREFCVMETTIGELKSRLWIYEEWSGSNLRGSIIGNGPWKKAQRISLHGIKRRMWSLHFLNQCSNLIALHLATVDLEGHVLDLNGVCNLKSLKINIWYGCEVRGLGLLRQLCWLEWDGRVPSNMGFIEEIGRLTKLQVLNLFIHYEIVEMQFPILSNLRLLQHVGLSGLYGGVSISFNSTMSNLHELDLCNCPSLQSCNGIGDLVNLEKLRIWLCPCLEALPNLQVFKNLKDLAISNCTSIQALEGVGDLATLLELNVEECPSLIGVPNLSKLTNLQVLRLRDCSLKRAMIELNELINLQDCSISMDGIREFIDLHKLIKLRSITIYGWSPYGSLSINSLVNLEDLSIFGCKGVDSLGGLSKVTRLQSITLEDCEFKDVACLKDLIGLCSISIQSCFLLESFPNMHNSTRLERLDFSQCGNPQKWEGLSGERATSFGAIGVVFHIGGTFPNLRYLQLYWISMKEFPDLSNFPKLEDVVIHGCWNLVSVTISVPLMELKSFHVEDCRSLTTIPTLIGCNQLESVIVEGSKVTLSEDEIQKLRIRCPTIVIESN